MRLPRRRHSSFDAEAAAPPVDQRFVKPTSFTSTLLRFVSPPTLSSLAPLIRLTILQLLLTIHSRSQGAVELSTDDVSIIGEALLSSSSASSLESALTASLLLIRCSNSLATRPDLGICLFNSVREALMDLLWEYDRAVGVDEGRVLDREVVETLVWGLESYVDAVNESLRESPWNPLVRYRCS